MTSYKGFLCAFEAKVEREMGRKWSVTATRGARQPTLSFMLLDQQVKLCHAICPNAKLVNDNWYDSEGKQLSCVSQKPYVALVLVLV